MILLEEIRDQNKAVFEAVGDIQRKVSDLPIRSEFNELRQDVKTIKAVIADTNRDLAEHKRLQTDVTHGSGHVSQSRRAAA